MQKSNRTVFAEFQNVPRGTFEKLEAYVVLLEKWQKSINLISAQEQDVWLRHIKDSLQLQKYIEKLEPSSIIDMGSGGGLPAIVLASAEPKHRYTLIESDRKKCIFLQQAVRELSLENVEIINERIEKWRGWRADVITSRALASVQSLLEYATPMMADGAFCLFLKGANYDMEVAEAKKQWSFQIETHPSQTDSQARVLKIDQICRTIR